MNNIQSVKSIRNSRSFLLNALLIVFLFVINVSAFGNGVTNAGNTNARIADVRERGVQETIKVAIAKTTANPQFGSGGAWQVFVDDFTNKLKLVNEIPLK